MKKKKSSSSSSVNGAVAKQSKQTATRQPKKVTSLSVHAAQTRVLRSTSSSSSCSDDAAVAPTVPQRASSPPPQVGQVIQLTHRDCQLFEKLGLRVPKGKHLRDVYCFTVLPFHPGTYVQVLRLIEDVRQAAKALDKQQEPATCKKTTKPLREASTGNNDTMPVKKLVAQQQKPTSPKPACQEIGEKERSPTIKPPKENVRGDDDKENENQPPQVEQEDDAESEPKKPAKRWIEPEPASEQQPTKRLRKATSSAEHKTPKKPELKSVPRDQVPPRKRPKRTTRSTRRSRKSRRSSQSDRSNNWTPILEKLMLSTTEQLQKSWQSILMLSSLVLMDDENDLDDDLSEELVYEKPEGELSFVSASSSSSSSARLSRHRRKRPHMLSSLPWSAGSLWTSWSSKV